MLMPTMLLGLLAVSIPILLHLLHRQQTQPVQWGAMQFLRPSQQQKKQRKKVDHWLLMLMRMLAVGLLAFLLARPKMPQGMIGSHGITDSPADVAVIIDHSLSTGRTSVGKTVFDRSRTQADNLLNQLAANDTFSVILAEHRARPLNAQPVKKNNLTTINQVRDQLAGLPQGMTDCSIPEAISDARRLLARGRNSAKVIVIFSDQHRTNWHICNEALWRSAVGDHTAKDLAIHSFPVFPDAEFVNVSVSSLHIEPAVIGINRPVQITAQIANTGTKPIAGMVAQLLVNGNQTDSKPVTPLAPKSSATIRFNLDAGLTTAGSNWLKVAVNANDGLAADDAAFAVANVLKSIPVLVIDGQFSDAGDFKSSRFLQAAMQPADPSLIHAKIVSISQSTSVHLDDYTVVVLNDLPALPSVLRDRLSDYVRGGHGLWIILGAKSPQAMIEKDLASSALFTATAGHVIDSSNAPSFLEVKDLANPVVHVITDSQQNALTGAEVRKWWSLKPTDAQTILSATNGDPLVIEHTVGSSGGIVDIWASSVDGSWNNLNLMPNFVPLVNETIYHLASPAMHGVENRGIDAGQPIEWAGPAVPAVSSVQITLPDGTTSTHPANFNNGRWLLTDPDTYLPGIYKLTFSPVEIPSVYYGVNIDRSELDPVALDTDDFNWLKHAGYLDPALPIINETDLPGIIPRRGQPSEMWGLLGGLLLAMLLLETYLTRRLINSQQRSPVAAGGHSEYAQAH